MTTVTMWIPRSLLDLETMEVMQDHGGPKVQVKVSPAAYAALTDAPEMQTERPPRRRHKPGGNVVPG